MCGICGIVRFDDQIIEEKHLKQMMQEMHNRGPDDNGYYIHENIGFGFVRLSILDLSSAGHQPMFSQDKNYCIIFNGEVFNYLELREELSSKYVFKSGTDTEVVLNSYIEWGVDCLNRFNGMFAFAIYEKLHKKIFIGRDRFGIKPFYYFLSDKKFVFASDIPPILKLLPMKTIPDEEIIFYYLLTNRTNYTANTFFSQIKKLQPGHFLIVEKNEIKIKRWYNIAEKLEGSGFKDSEEYLQYFKDSIKLQLRSDVPVGICLSGGLDSSAITSVLIRDFNMAHMHTFSAIYNYGDESDEQEFIKTFNNELVNIHFAYPKGEGLLEDIDKFVSALSEPIPRTSEYAEFKVMELAKKYCTVILNGQGADEILGGYHYFFGAYFFELFRKAKVFEFINESISYCRLHKNTVPLKFFLFYLMSVSIKSKLLFKRKNLININFYRKYSNSSESIVRNLYCFKTMKEFFINHFEHKFEHNLLWADKSGMYFSLETRFPFLDHRLIEKTLATPNHEILSKGWTKVILRNALNGRLQDKIRLRKDKIGYSTPEKDWFRQPDFISFINDIINSPSFRSRPYFNTHAVFSMLHDHFGFKSDNSNEIWKIIHLELWLRKYFD